MAKTTSPTNRLRKWLFTFFKIAIAVLGLWYVSYKLTWNDSAIIPKEGSGAPPIRNVTFMEDTPVAVLGTRVEPASPGNATPERTFVHIRFPNKPVKVKVETASGIREAEMVLRAGTLIPGTNEQLNIPQDIEVSFNQLKEEKAEGQEKGQFIHPGLRSLLKTAGGKWPLLAGAWALLVIPFFVTAIRWRNLMRPQGINMPLGKCLQLTFVGQFYSIMLPGITGGDLVKIIYTARLTGSKSKSFITIILDRVIGLVALMIIAGVSAGVQLLLNHQAGVPSNNTLINVFIMIVLMLVALATGATVYFSNRLRRLVGIEWFIEHLGSTSENQEEGRAKLEHLFRLANGLALVVSILGIAALAALRWGTQLTWAQKNGPIIFIGIGVLGLVAIGALAGLALHNMLVVRARPVIRRLAEAVVHVDQTLHVYRGHFGVLGWAFVISLVSQVTLPLSAWLCGLALDMRAPMSHYLAYVPVAVLAASLPISPPQGFGVMDSLLAHFFRESARAGQAFMLAQGIRFLPILWNLVGGYWVITGKYSRSAELLSPQAPEKAPSPAIETQS
jgi:uncharacterized membrane protein YbhN (UPF0104 family)